MEDQGGFRNGAGMGNGENEGARFGGVVDK